MYSYCSLKVYSWLTLLLSGTLLWGDEVFRNSVNDSKVSELLQNAKGRPSNYSMDIASNLVGRWKALPDTWSRYLGSSTGKTDILWHALTFYRNGMVEGSYSVKDNTGQQRRLSGTYEVVHKGAEKSFPGKRPNIVLRSELNQAGEIAIFANVDVGLDSRFPSDMIVLEVF